MVDQVDPHQDLSQLSRPWLLNIKEHSREVQTTHALCGEVKINKTPKTPQGRNSIQVIQLLEFKDQLL